MQEAEATPADEAADLLARIATGSEPALRDFYQAYHTRIYAFALKRLRDPADAADVLNEVMLEVWRKAARYEGRARVLTWVLGIANHKLLDRLRRRGRHATEALDENLAADVPDADAALAGAQDAARVRRCLDVLSDAHRLIVHLAFFEELPYEEIAEIADCPVNTVKTRMFHAKRRLKRCLAGMAGE
jgi:RNA polymerase sigma-70 factor, ECF subfamily